MKLKKSITETDFIYLPEKLKDKYKQEWQTNLHGIWVSGYMFLNFPKIRKVYKLI